MERETNTCPICGGTLPHPAARYCDGKFCLWQSQRKREHKLERKRKQADD